MSEYIAHEVLFVFSLLLLIKKLFKNIYPAGDACQKPKLKPEKRSSVTFLMWAVAVCLFILSVIFFTSYMYIRFRMKPSVDLTQAL